MNIFEQDGRERESERKKNISLFLWSKPEQPSVKCPERCTIDPTYQRLCDVDDDAAADGILPPPHLIFGHLAPFFSPQDHVSFSSPFLPLN